MKNEKDHPLYKHYLLLDNKTKKPLEITLDNKTYIFIVNSGYFSSSKKDFFTFKEKLYILNLPHDVIWHPISLPKVLFKVLFYNTISPFNFKLNIAKDKITPYISGKEV